MKMFVHIGIHYSSCCNLETPIFGVSFFQRFSAFWGPNKDTLLRLTETSENQTSAASSGMQGKELIIMEDIMAAISENFMASITRGKRKVDGKQWLSATENWARRTKGDTWGAMELKCLHARKFRCFNDVLTTCAATNATSDSKHWKHALIGFAALEMKIDED